MNVAHDVFDMLGVCVGRDRVKKSAVKFANKINKLAKKKFGHSGILL